MAARLKIAGIIRESIVDGPGIRFVVFAQGCSHRCPGCHNPQTHDPEGGNWIGTDRILQEIAKNPILKGVTFSGGEPFEQPEAMAELAKGVKEMGLDLISYSGYTFEELLEMAEEDENIRYIIEQCRMIIDGRFILDRKTLALPFRGSTNQRLVDVQASLEAGEVIVFSDPA
ncbi:MAG: anaerobic ribonucleoside-triphosphate reductase activating protein [Firmicutes bacterium]|jgi:anaerobic ribonucleoside-triphosphate reductase activating protein|nr:anaerobic ribonucleoside-triphosphate reductase activating protein [Bacillota bacterium]MBR6504103.1 anaerobic ribonucleoside-triphosphate reductase activating protein [Bacillota bacterium]